MNWESYREWPLSGWRYYLEIFLEGLKKTAESFNQDSRPPNRGVNPTPPSYEADGEVL
jgi:hypothetical protein